MSRPRGAATLYINDEPVGEVAVRRTEDSWSLGLFTPAPSFAKFAPVFAEWSRIMHAGAVSAPLSRAESDNLRRVECEIDRLRARLHFPGRGEWVTCAQVNIDGRLIEWKVGWSGEREA